MEFKVDIYHNVTTVAQAYENGTITEVNDEFIERRGDDLAIRSRIGRDSGARIAKNDILVKVGTLELVDPSNAWSAFNVAYNADNAPYDAEGVEEYDSWGVRSLSVGDVVVVHTPDGPEAKCVDSVGWGDVDLSDFTLEG